MLQSPLIIAEKIDFPNVLNNINFYFFYMVKAPIRGFFLFCKNFASLG